MRRVFAVLFVASLTVSAADPSGVWQLAYTTENGHVRESKLDLKVDGNSLAGTLSSERGTAKLENGRISGDEIGFDVVRRSNNDEVTVHFKGKVEGGTMKLTMQFGNRAAFTMLGKKGS